MGEKSAQVTIKSGSKYKYDSTTQGKEIDVEVVGKALGQDENSKPDTTKPEHKNMWKVKSDKGEFWVAPTALKSEVGAKTQITAGETYKYTLKSNNQEVDATVVALLPNNQAKITYPGMPAKLKGGFPVDASKLRTK